MQLVKVALTETTSHGLARVVSNKPIYIRVVWLLLFLLLFGLFLKYFFELVEKLRSPKVTTSIDFRSEKFQFPDLYVCFENPVSGSYSSNVGDGTAQAINASFRKFATKLHEYAKRYNASAEQVILVYSQAYPHGLPYKLLFDALAHRLEQSVISSGISYIGDFGAPEFAEIPAKAFNHPMYLRCLRWSINSTWQDRITNGESWSEFSATLLLDTNSSIFRSKGIPLSHKIVLPDGTGIPPSDWTLSLQSVNQPDRLAGLRMFLSPPGEYPSAFVRSFLLGPGKFHSLEIEMTRNVLTEGHFNCLGKHPEVKFTNPDDLSAYSHAYSYSYCYYLEYHRQAYKMFNTTGLISPLPWPLRNNNFVLNLSSETNFFTLNIDSKLLAALKELAQNIRMRCEGKRLCSTLEYSTSISSADWPTDSSLQSFVNFSVRRAWMRAVASNLSVPALDFLTSANASDVASYARKNLLKVVIKPKCLMCQRITFSNDYNFSTFISEVGGIMGIYLGMSLLTLCELLELVHNIFVWYFGKRHQKERDKNRADSVCSSTNKTSGIELVDVE